MRRRKNLLPLLLFTLLSFALLISLILNVPPDSPLTLPPFPFPFPPLTVFFPFVFVAAFSLCSLLLNNSKWGFLLALGLSVFLLLRFLQLTHPFYLVLLLATLVSLVFALRKH